eukprot:1157723-Pelagomonas_calceolata.AAC.9
MPLLVVVLPSAWAAADGGVGRICVPHRGGELLLRGAHRASMRVAAGRLGTGRLAVGVSNVTGIVGTMGRGQSH